MVALVGTLQGDIVASASLGLFLLPGFLERSTFTTLDHTMLFRLSIAPRQEGRRSFFEKTRPVRKMNLSLLSWATLTLQREGCLFSKECWGKLMTVQ